MTHARRALLWALVVALCCTVAFMAAAPPPEPAENRWTPQTVAPAVIYQEEEP